MYKLKRKIALGVTGLFNCRRSRILQVILKVTCTRLDQAVINVKFTFNELLIIAFSFVMVLNLL